jgi:hypothetical protein
MRVYLAALILASTFAACASPASVSPSAFLPRNRSLTLKSSSGQYLYVASAKGGVSVYPLGGTAPIRTLSKGVDLPTAIAFDKLGNLYVANHDGGPSGRGFISVFAPGATTPERKISNGVNVPYSLALDSKGNLYVANYIRALDAPKLSNGSVTVYKPNADKPYRTLTHTPHPHQIAIDSSDDLYVAGLRLELYAPGATTPTRSFGRFLPFAIGIDSKNRLYAGFFGTCPNYCYGSIAVFASGKEKPIAAFDNFNDADYDGYVIGGFAFDSLDDFVFSLNNGPVHIGGGLTVKNGEVGIYPTLHRHDGRHRYWILNGAADGPNVVVVDPSDNVVVGNNGAVNAFLAHKQSLLYTITQGISGQVTALAISSQ